MVCHYAKSLFRDFFAALRGKTPWYEVRYSAYRLWSDLIHPARRVVYGVRNIYAYFPLIWRDCDWDNSPMFLMWELKFRRMAHQHLVHGNHTNHVSVARTLRVCAALCKRIREDDYADVDENTHDKKWGKSKMVTLPLDNPDARSVEVRFIRKDVRNDADEKAEREEFRRYIAHADKQRENDLKYLGKLIAGKALHWWD